MHPKEFYKTYLADDKLSPLSWELINHIAKQNPQHALDFGSGSGKHSDALRACEINPISLDISMSNCIVAWGKYHLPCVLCTDETYLRNLANIDVVFTCSVLDHIEDIDGIIQEFKRIANKAIFLAETNDVPGQFYYPHNYESYGFKKRDFEYTGEDGAKYFIWEYHRLS